MQGKKRIVKFFEGLKAEDLVLKYLNTSCRSPIIVTPDAIILYWRKNKRIFERFIERVVQDNKDIIAYGSFKREYNGIPAHIEFELSEKGKECMVEYIGGACQNVA